MDVTLHQILEARDRRAALQRQLLSQYPGTLLCFTMNIPGPEKNSPLIRRGFLLGRRLLEQQLMAAGTKILCFRQREEDTGCEAMYMLDCDPAAAKKIAVTIEDHTPAGRLFDMDVLRRDGTKVPRQELGLKERRCLICGGPAPICARSRTHPLEALQNWTRELLEGALKAFEERRAARIACQALLYEAAVTPKPGLVDRANSGSHADMDFYTFQASAAALWPYFAECRRIGAETRELLPRETFARLRTPGLLAEGEMLRATGGVNTHKGAIFSLGILCAALGRLGGDFGDQPQWILWECARMAEGLVEGDLAGLTPETAKTTGQKLYLRQGITGVRGQAEAGFPAVGKVGLPRLEEGLSRGLSPDEAGSAALLALMAASVDTNLIARSDLDTQQRISLEIAIALYQNPFPKRDYLEKMDREFIEKNLSPGGSADLLALCWFLHLLKEDETAFARPLKTVEN